jgi:hypothetical protein
MLVILLAVLVGFRRVRYILACSADSDWLPQEMKAAKLKFAEQTFKVWRPFGLIARVDRAYLLGDEMRLLEFKTRKYMRVYRSYVIELSAQRMAIEENAGGKVSDIGYVLIQDPTGRNRSVKVVRLLQRTDLISIRKRRDGILAGTLAPRYADSDGLCRNCGFREECRPDLRKWRMPRSAR